ncbi:MAG TPA: LysR substrate-binding domain-containing protein [Roseiarcus sp.]|jgi:LysR family hydrogen peroxide-inducible transcriptional activator
MNLRDLEYVVAVADHSHFGRAATACNVSQPTLSGQILKLEAELGLRLFDREGRGARVSDRAATVVAQARATLAAAAGVSAAAAAARDPFAGELRLGIITTVAPYLLPIALPALAEALPKTPLYLVEDLTDRLLARLRDGGLDAVIIATDPREARLTSTELYDEPFFLVFSESGEKCGRASIGVEEIDPNTLLLLAEGHCLRDQTLALCNAAERTALGADVRGTSLETLRHLAAAGQGATLAPLLAYADWRRSGAGIAGLKIVGEGASRVVRLVFKRGSAREAALEALAASLRSTAGAALAKRLRETERDLKHG